MAARNRRQLLGAGLAVPFAMAFPRLGRSAAVRGAVLSGTFLQLLQEHRSWDENRWQRLFDDFRRLRLSRVILQWVISDGQAFFGPGRLQGSPAAALETILELGERADLQITVGLVHDSDYWQRIAQPVAAVATYLADRESRLVKVVREIAPLLSGRRCFAGWFMNEELEDVHWQEPPSAAVLHSYLHRVSDFLRWAVPGAHVAISGFSNAYVTPAQLQVFWQEVLRAAPAIDTVLFQDGVGARKLTLENLSQYLCAVRTAADAAGRRLWSVVELFDQMAGPPLDVAQFRARAAPFARVAEQLRIESACASAMIGFSAADYLLAATEPAADLLSSYLRYIQT